MSQEHQPSTSEEHELERRAVPKIYIASLSDYNAGRLHGRWIDAAQSPEALHAAISEMLATSPTPGAEEWAIHDYEGFGPLRLSEYESVETISTLSLAIAEHGPAFAAWVAQTGIREPEEFRRFTDCYLGHWDSVETYVQELADDLGIQPRIDEAAGSLAPYVRLDVEALARDMVLSGDLHVAEAADGGVYLFQS